MILVCPPCGWKLKSGCGIPPRGIIFACSIVRKFLCNSCKKEVIPVEFENDKDYWNFVKEHEKRF